jgi:transglutaminase-like putative cysteine protease
MNKLKFLTVDLPEDLKNTVYFGDFQKSQKLIDIYLKRNIPDILKQRLIFERGRIERLKEDYDFTYESALNYAQSKIKNFTKEELEFLKDERYADWIYINGKIMFHHRFLENIVKVNSDFKSRLIQKEENSSGNSLLNKTVKEIIEKGEKKYFIQVMAGIKLDKELSRIGETVNVHLPIPRAARQIKDIKILSTSHKAKYISPLQYPQRTIFFEEKVKGGDTFFVEYSYENHIKYVNPDPSKVSAYQPNFCTEEWPPHIRFTPFLVSLAKEIVGKETNPLLRARRIYDYITENIQYSYMRQYAAITNIPEYCAYNQKGDCGVQAILFITLCRIIGIPAKWQSGLYVDPYSAGCHDWAEFYVEPYGWLFADPSFGGGALRNNDKERWNFYFGNLDPFRMVANSDFHYDFYPERKFLRHDPYDNQVGEIEYSDRPLESNEYKTLVKSVEVHEI